MRFAGREQQGEGTPFSRRAFDENLPPMLLDYFFADREAESRPFSHGVRREKRLEYFGQVLFWDSLARVDDLYFYLVLHAFDVDGDASSFGHGILCIHQEIDQHLLDLV